jgi:outer membrane protein assembly factor BamB
MEQAKVCELHPGEKVVGFCSRCRKPICVVCTKLYGYFCGDECKRKAKAQAPPAAVVEGRAELATFGASLQRILWFATRVVLPVVVLAIVLMVVFKSTDKSGKEVWRFKSPSGQPLSGLAADGARLYVACADELVYALDKSTGAVCWTFKAGPGCGTAQPVCAGGLCLVQAGKTLYALSAPDGKLAWKLDLPARLNEPPVIGAETLCYVDAVFRKPTPEEAVAAATGEGPRLDPSGRIGAGTAVHALRLKDGTELWKKEYTASRFGLRELAIAGGTLYASSLEIEKDSAQTVLLAFDLATGAGKWKAAVSGGDYGPRSVQATPQGVLVATENQLYFILAEGKEAWRVKRASHAWDPVVDGEKLYCGQLGALLCLDLASGREIWKAALPEETAPGAPVAIPGLVLVSAYKKQAVDKNVPGGGGIPTYRAPGLDDLVKEFSTGEGEGFRLVPVLCALDAASGKLKWSLDQSGDRILHAGGRLFSVDCRPVPSLTASTEIIQTHVTVLDPASGSKLGRHFLDLDLHDCVADDKRFYLSSTSSARHVSMTGVQTLPKDSAVSAISIGR